MSHYISDLTCRFQQDMIVCSPHSRGVVGGLLPFRLQVAVPVRLQLSPGEHHLLSLIPVQCLPIRFILVLTEQSTILNKESILRFIFNQNVVLDNDGCERVFKHNSNIKHL